MDTPEIPTSSTNPTGVTGTSLRFCFTPRFFLGLIVLALGVVFLLDRFQVLEAKQAFRFAPLILVAIGLVKLVAPSTTASRLAGGFWLVIGLLLFGHTMHYFRLDFGLLWPLVLVGLGAWLVGRALTSRQRGADGTGHGPVATIASDTFSCFAMMGGVDRKMASQQFRGGEATAIMGGCEIDLREAALAGTEAVIDVFAMWGGIDLIVPDDWTVIMMNVVALGGVEDSRKKVGKDPNKRLVIKGLVLMGGVEIRN